MSESNAMIFLNRRFYKFYDT
ncbi:hypothetical protein EYZ11_013586 [Aspergillus tanneri]|uniref:Uncharacterized protein n=1 Tax=Aspergillus tanneri TaxID=1220188 RepID=A0A4S3IZH5_9EURO|nr:hypothetical protein EYZ11_013586 [Aspergillus tanneri]